MVQARMVASNAGVMWRKWKKKEQLWSDEEKSQVEQVEIFHSYVPVRLTRGMYQYTFWSYG